MKIKIMKKKQYIEKSKILNEIKSRLKYVRDPFEHNIHTNKLEEVYEDLIDFINDLKVKTIEVTKNNNSMKKVDLDNNPYEN